MPEIIQPKNSFYTRLIKTVILVAFSILLFACGSNFNNDGGNNLQSQVFSFDSSSYTVTVGGTTTVQARGQGSGAITYSIENSDVARINGSGTVTPVAEGETTITAFIRVDAVYDSSTTTALLTVLDPNCRVGDVIAVGQSCDLPGGGTFRVVISGGSACAIHSPSGNDVSCDASLTINSFRATRVSQSYRIDSFTTAPDLMVSSFSANPTSINAGGNISLSATVRNSGTGQSGSTTLRYYRSSNRTISTSDTRIGTDSVSALSAGRSGNESVTVTGHNSGTAYYGACVESVSGETQTSNNCSSGVAVTVDTPDLIPDLMVSSFRANPTSINAGGNISLSATVRNSGTGQSGSTTLRYYRSSDRTISTLDTQIGTDSVSALSAGRSGNESVTVTGHNSGTAYYGACVESVSGETQTSNNCSSGVAVTVDTPDLIVSSFRANPTSINAGGNISLSATVRNSGTGQSGSTTLRYYRSSDRTISTLDTRIGTDSVSALSAGRSGNESVTVTGHNSGTAYYGACVESVSGETQTSNNCSSGVAVTVDTPDLIVSSFSANPTSINAGGNISLSATVRNSGTGQSGLTTLRYYRSSDRTISTLDTRIGTDLVSALSAGRSGNESVTVTGHNSGTAYYGACVESVSGETQTSNNCSSGVAVTVDTPDLIPDLMVSSFRANPTSINAGGNISLSATVRNSGTGQSGSTTLRYYRSSDRTISTSDTQIGTDSVSALSAGRSGNESVTVTGHNSGTAYYGACVESVSGETQTSNNCSSGVAVTVDTPDLIPDLMVSSFRANPTSINAGGNISLSATVRNSGTGQSGSTTLRYYRSSDRTISTLDTRIGTDSVSALSAGRSGNESVTVTGHNSGTAYYGACVESVSGETQTSNNCSSGVAVTVDTNAASYASASNINASSRLVFRWNAFSGARTYHIYGSGSLFLDDSATLLTSLSNTARTYTYSGISYFSYGVFACTSSSCSISNLESVVNTRTPEVFVTWNRVSGATNYRVYRSVIPSCSFSLTTGLPTGICSNATRIGTVTQNSFTDSSPSFSGIYFVIACTGNDC